MRAEYVIVLVIVLYAAEVIRHTLNQRRWDRERERLLDRLQARSLGELVTVEAARDEMAHPKRFPAMEVERESAYMEPEDLPESLIQEAQTGFNTLMG